MSVRVPVSPAVLEWAAGHADGDFDAIAGAFPSWNDWVTGRRKPTVSQLEKLAAKTGVPFGYLLLTEPPTIELPIPDFREGFGGAVEEPSSSLIAVINQSLRRQDWFRGYAIDNGQPQVDFVGSASAQPSASTAAEMRRVLSFEVPDRSGSWNGIRRQLVNSFESAGGLSVVTAMVENNTHRMLNPDEFRGFSLVDEYAPLIFINANQTLNGQIFTMAHELAHIWQGSSGVSLEEPQGDVRSEVERWCNAVASEFLVPSEDLSFRYQSVARLPLRDQLDELAAVYKCGTLVILQVLRAAGLREFDDFDATYSNEVDRLNRIASGRSSGGGNFYYNQPYRIGERLSRAIVHDTLEGNTSFSEAMSLMSLGSLSVFNRYARHLGV